MVHYDGTVRIVEVIRQDRGSALLIEDGALAVHLVVQALLALLYHLLSHSHKQGLHALRAMFLLIPMSVGAACRVRREAFRPPGDIGDEAPRPQRRAAR